MGPTIFDSFMVLYGENHVETTFHIKILYEVVSGLLGPLCILCEVYSKPWTGALYYKKHTHLGGRNEGHNTPLGYYTDQGP